MTPAQRRALTLLAHPGAEARPTRTIWWRAMDGDAVLGSIHSKTLWILCLAGHVRWGYLGPGHTNAVQRITEAGREAAQVLRHDAGSRPVTRVTGRTRTQDVPSEALSGLPGPFGGGVRHSESRTVAQAILSVVWRSMSEREFQGHVVAALEQRGWRVHVVPDMRKTRAGLPDLLCLRPGRIVFLELKREVGGRVRPEQQDFINDAATVPGVYAKIVKPSQWPDVLREIEEEAR